ncbi:MAG: hypothetical protein LBC85_00420 [Fibromonadaceae bacterium]|jgi:uncharacterized protein YbaR (Trm112 family)|nr:hypothetical protein [Fibromonadaceae bacterium]
MLSKELLEILCCPITKQPLQEENGTLVTVDGKMSYPINDGVPVLLREAGVSVDLVAKGVESRE